MEELIIPDGDQLPRIIDGQTYVPLRYTFEKMGYNIAWESETHYIGSNPKGTVTITNSAGNRIIVKEGLSCFTTNGMEFENLNKVNNIAVGGRILMPVRGILESIGCTVEWNKLSATEAEVNIRTNLEGYYRIKNNSGKYLTYVKPVTASDTAVQVKGASNADDQIWKIKKSTLTGKYHIYPAASNSYGLNIYRISSYLCTIQPIQGNVADTSFYITCVPGYKYTIAWENSSSTRYLSVDGNDTKWKDSTPAQEWTLEDADYIVPEITNQISLPINISQRYYSSKLSGQCAAACAIDLSIFYNFDTYDKNYNISSTENLASTLQKIVDEKSEELIGNFGLIWGNIKDFGYYNTKRNGDITESTIISMAIESIRNNTPMMLHYYTDSLTHWVIVVGCDENTASIDDLIVCDPYTNEETCVNTPWTFKESRGKNMKNVDISDIHFGYVTTYKI